MVENSEDYMAIDTEMDKKIGERRELEQSKSTYYYQGIIAALIAFSINLTLDRPISPKILPLHIAIGFWLYAFYCGHKNRMSSLCVSSAQQLLMKPRSKERHDFLRNEFVRFSKLASDYFNRQFKYMFIGITIFILWFIIEKNFL